MLYIVTALKSEAQAFVDKYSLTKSKLQNFTIFSNKDMILIVSNIGVINARQATQALINQYDITDDDTYLNIGICGASVNYTIGDLLEVGSVVYDGMEYSFHTDATTVTCVDEEISEASYEVVDMESYGFYDAVIHNPAIKNFYILKVVSDHFEPEKVTKDGSKQLVFKILSSSPILKDL
ncbi:MAG: hypothetical protein U9O86_07845 [Campylobacterota bacterium]|nr:hypothetical protein [Campylobacterota bacterium]